LIKKPRFPGLFIFYAFFYFCIVDFELHFMYVQQLELNNIEFENTGSK